EQEKLKTPDEASSYKDYINHLDTRFTVTLINLLDQINDVGRDSSNDRLCNLLY
ncbi:hypothetical protein CBL_20130, partial [Carabus blaptoides fortunei]